MASKRPGALRGFYRLGREPSPSCVRDDAADVSRTAPSVSAAVDPVPVRFMLATPLIRYTGRMPYIESPAPAVHHRVDGGNLLPAAHLRALRGRPARRRGCAPPQGDGAQAVSLHQHDGGVRAGQRHLAGDRIPGSAAAGCMPSSRWWRCSIAYHISMRVYMKRMQARWPRCAAADDAALVQRAAARRSSSQSCTWWS